MSDDEQISAAAAAGKQGSDDRPPQKRPSRFAPPQGAVPKVGSAEPGGIESLQLPSSSRPTRPRETERDDTQELTNSPDGQLLTWLIEDTKDAKRAPEIPAWLVCGPLPLSEIISMRNERLRSEGASQTQADSYSSASVLYDLGRVAGHSGPVEYTRGMLRLKDSYQQLILGWIWAEQYRRFGPIDDASESVS